MLSVLVTLWLAQSWPAMDPNLSPDALADRRPNDPGYAPWASGGACVGQMSLYGFTPPCLGGSGPVGASVDRAWLLELGLPSVTIAVVAGGIDLTDRDLAPKIRLNPGEASIPDRDGDGVLTVLDLTSVTGTAAPTVEEVIDPRLLSRPDRGDVDGDGWITPADVIAIFANGRDDDGNGLVDDIAGFDFLDGDPDPSPEEGDDRGTRAARAAGARTHDGYGVAGACPGCTLLPLRVGRGGLAMDAELGAAALYAARMEAAVAAVLVATPGPTPYLDRALARSTERVVLVLDAGDGPGLIEDVPSAEPGALRVGGAAPRSDVACGRGALELDGLLPGVDCGDELDPPPSGVVAGIAGLMASAARRRGFSLSPAEIASLLRQSDPMAPRSPSSGTTRFDARRAVERVIAEQRPPALRVRLPRPKAVIDPTPTPLRVVAELLEAAPEGGLRFRLLLGRGWSPTGFEVVTEGELPPGSRRIEALLETEGLQEDPARVPAGADESAFVLRVVVERPSGVAAQVDRVFFLMADLDLFPGFPVELGAGVFGGPRRADLGQGQQIWVPLLDGRLLALDPTGSLARSIPARQRPPGLDEPVAAGVPYLSAPALRQEVGGWRIGAVAEDGVLTLVGETVQRVGLDTAGPAFGPPMAVLEDEGDRFAWVAGGRVVKEDGDGASPWFGAEALGALALDGRRAWVKTPTELVASDGSRFEVDPTPARHGLERLRGEAPVVARVAGVGERVFALSGSDVVGLGPEQETVRWARPEAYAGPALSADGSRVLAWFVREGRLFPTPVPNGLWEPADPGSGAEVVIADVDGGAPEWIFGGDAQLLALSENGRPAVGWPKLTGAPVLGAPEVADLDGDGRPEVIAATRDGRLFVWRTRGRVEQVRWAGERGGPRASGRPGEADQVAATERGCSAVDPIGLWLAGLAFMALARRGARPSDRGRSARATL